MMTTNELEARLRAMERPGLPEDLRTRVLAAAATQAAPHAGIGVSFSARRPSWRFAVAAIALSASVATGVWMVRVGQDAATGAAGSRSLRTMPGLAGMPRPSPVVIPPPGDDVVVLWVDDDVPVFVELMR